MKNIIDQLRVHETMVQRELDSVSAQADLSDQLARIREAIAALDGKQRPLSKGATKAIAKKTPSEDEVKTILHSLISEHGSLSSDDLYTLLEAQVLRMGKAKFGLRSKFAKIIALSPKSISPGKPDQLRSTTTNVAG